MAAIIYYFFVSLSRKFSIWILGKRPHTYDFGFQLVVVGISLDLSCT